MECIKKGLLRQIGVNENGEAVFELTELGHDYLQRSGSPKAKAPPTMNDLDAEYDAAIEPVIETLHNFVRLHRALFPDELSINRERFLGCWLAEVLMGVDINLERAVESLRDDGLTLLDDPLLEVNSMRPHTPRLWEAPPRRRVGASKEDHRLDHPQPLRPSPSSGQPRHR